MRAHRYVGVTILSAVVLAGLWPGSLLAQSTSADRSIGLAQRQVTRKPYDATAYYRLGDAYIQKARESGDVTYFDLAGRALGKALELAPRSSDAARHLAFVLYARHDFDGAAREARRAVDLNPTDAYALGVLGDAYLEVGKYEAARETYGTMTRLRADLYSFSRRSGLRSLTGDPEGALEDLRRAIADGQASRRPRESVAWAQWQLGSDYFALGRLPEAEAQYQEALGTYPNYYRALAGLAQVRAAQRRYDQAIELYKQALGVIPLPDYAAALGDVYARIGRSDEAQRQYDLVEYIGHLNAINKVIYNRELAYFYADHDLKLEQALDLAKKELEVRTDVYAYDVLAWALLKNGSPREALAAITEALKLGTRDARLFFHAGMIHHALGDAEQTRHYLGLALVTNPHFHPFHSETARRVLRETGAEETARVVVGGER